MNAHERRPLNAETAEQLLSGRPVAYPGSRRLAESLAAASAAAFPGELAGEDTAVAAFRHAADVDVAPQPGRKPMIKSALVAKLLTVKAAAIAVVVLSAGGVALAATTGVLPTPFDQAPGNPGHSTPASDRTNGPGGANGTPSPSLTGLCTSYLAGAGNERGKALENPAFSALITAAGGADQVDAYCAGLGVTAPGSGQGSGGPGGNGSGGPTSHPGATDHPTGAPSNPGS